MKKYLGLQLVVLAMFALPSAAQFQLFKMADKTVPVSIPHAPIVGLTVKRVAFDRPSGPCADQLVNSQIMPDFQRNNMDIVDLQHLNQILAEQNFSQTQQGELARGKVLGPSVMIFVRVDDCTPSQTPLVNRSQTNIYNQVITTYVAKTRVSIHGSVQVTDLTSGQSLGSHPFSATPEKENTSTDGQPEFPPADEVREEGLREAAEQIHNIFFPYIESVRLFVHDDKDCGLKQVAELIHGGDRTGAQQLSQSNLKQCTSQKNDKVLGRAYYDAGIAAMIAGDYAAAKPLFTQAMQMKGADEAVAALQVCNRAEVGTAAVKRYQEKVAAIPMPAPISYSARAPVEPPMQTIASPGPAVGSVSQPNSGQTTVESRLKRLDQLLKQGLITKKEYDEKKADILKDL